LKALAVDLIIGYGISDKLLIYYNNKELWTETRRMSGKKEVFVNSMGPFGLSWYFKNNSPSLFLNAGAGFAHFYAPFENDQELDYGFGIYAGLGYEFIKHYSLNLTYMAGFTNREDDGIELGTDTQSLLFTLTALCY
ncbi:MAG: hypothetical protein JW864_08855, partial [Spirochaetes bacterium]|nr:hypothetical protein [Spirochaetota bacterium]